MSKVVLSIPKLGVTGKGIEKNKELYVVAFASDLNNTGQAKVSDVIAAHNETLPNVAPEIQKQALMQFMLVSVSNTFTRIRRNQSVSLSGSGIILYPHTNPNGLLASHFMVIESDQKTRDLGKFFGELFANEEIKSLVTLLKKGITQPLLAGLMNAAISQVPGMLTKNKDDLLFSHSHSGFDFDNYGSDSISGYTDYDLGNDMVNCVLRVRVTQ